MDRRRKPSRTVKPRKPGSNADRSIVVIIDDTYCTESGEIGNTSNLIEQLRHMPLTTVVTAQESAGFLKLVQDRWGQFSNFNFRVSPVEREIFTGKDHGRKLSLSLTSVSWFGWQGEKTGRNNSVRNRYHLLIDPLTFSNSWLDERTFSAYLKWAQDIRGFCIAQGWHLRPTQGSVARQALQDSRFYPDARRKVPRSTNERVRKYLPGNHYQLTVEPSHKVEYEADYLDQTRCHHHHALTAKLPDANSLVGYGHFRNPESGRTWRKSPERISSFLDGFMGLICGYLWWPIDKRDTKFAPRYLVDHYANPERERKPLYFYSEDLPLLDSLSVRCNGIVAAWGSKKQDKGIPTYARWALDELAKDSPGWKKTLLLSPYGALATTARKQTVAYHRSKSGKARTLRTKSGVQLPVSFHSATRVSEPGTNNVLHRGLIESANRTETLLFAQFLEECGYRVLCIYVDAVIIESPDDRVPELFHPWRHDRHLTHLRFLSESQYVSAEVEKLPGLSGQQRKLASFGQLKGAARLGDKDAMTLRKYRAWVEDRLPIPHPSGPAGVPAFGAYRGRN